MKLLSVFILAGLLGLAGMLPSGDGNAHPLPPSEEEYVHSDSDTSKTAESDTTGEKDEKGSKDWLISAPHGPVDTVNFMTDEATWLSLDISPDGKTIAFDILGDVYLLPSNGGDAERLTSGPAYDFQPRFSPEGSRVLFTSDRGGGDNIWTIRIDGTDLHPITSDKKSVINSGAWSPDGEYVVARKRLTDRSSIGSVELWLYHTMGGSGLQVTKKADIADANSPTFSPDGRWIYFAARRGRFSYNANVYRGIWQIRAYDRKTGQLRTFTDGYGGSAKPQISPDGTTLSFIRRDRSKTILVLHDLPSGRERVLFEGLDPDMQENFAWTGSYPGYAWTSDGSAIVISYDGRIHSINVADGTSRPIPFQARVEQEVTQALRFPQNIAPDSVRVRMISWPTQSPDGEVMVFSALGNLYRMDLKTGTPRRFPSKGPRAYSPNFSPDGNDLAYVTWSDTEGGQVWIMHGLGRGSKQVSRVPGQYSNPVFSLDGRKLAYLKGSGATGRGRNLGQELWFEIMWVPATGGEPQFVTTVGNRGAAQRMPRLAWSADGSRIFFNENQGSGEKGRTVLVSVRLDGTDRQEHLKIRHAEEIVPSPDGKWVAFNRLHKGYVIALPELGHEPVEVTGDKGSLPGSNFAEEGADWLNWVGRGKTLTWGFGPFFYRLDMADVLESWMAVRSRDGAKTEPKTEEESKDEDNAEDDEKEEDLTVVHPDTVEVVLEVPRAKPEGSFALKGARIVTMNGNEVIEPGTIVVNSDRIVAVGPETAVSIPEEARVFDMTGKTIIPGFVDVHAHMHYSYLDIIPENMSAYYANLAYGVTTTHDPSASTYAVFTQSEMVEAGVTLGPRTFSTGFILYGADIASKAPIDNLEDARKHIRRLKTLGAFSVKSYMQPRRIQRQWVIKAARDEEIMVVPEGGGNLEMNLSMVLDGHTGIEHSLPVTPIYKDVVTLMAKSGTGYTPTLLVAYGGLSGEHYFYQHYDVWKNEKLLRFLPRGQIDARSRRRPVMASDDDWHHMAVAAGCKKIVDAGGRVQLGGHGQLQGLGIHWELWAFVQGGMSTFDALRVGTLYGAEYLGLDNWVGSIETGKLADLVVLDRNPLEDIHHSASIHSVVKNGEVFDGNTMNRLWPSPASVPKFSWQAQGEMLGKPE